MKRFYISVVLLIIIFSFSFILNNKIARFTDEMINAVNESESPEQIQQFWNSKEKYVLCVLSHNQTEAVSVIIDSLDEYRDVSEEYYNIRKAELVSRLEAVRASLMLKSENVF